MFGIKNMFIGLFDMFVAAVKLVFISDLRRMLCGIKAGTFYTAVNSSNEMLTFKMSFP